MGQMGPNKFIGRLGVAASNPYQDLFRMLCARLIPD